MYDPHAIVQVPFFLWVTRSDVHTVLRRKSVTDGRLQTFSTRMWIC